MPHSWHWHGDRLRSTGRQWASRGAGERGEPGQRAGGHVPLGHPAKPTPEFHYVIALQLTSNYVNSQKAWTFELRSRGQLLPLNQGGRGNIWSMVDPSSLSRFIRNQELIFGSNCLCIYFIYIWNMLSIRSLKQTNKQSKKPPNNKQQQQKTKP